MRRILIYFLLICLSGCQVQLVSYHDQRTEDSITEIYKEIITQIDSIEIPDEPGLTSSSYIAYEEIDTEVKALIMRANAIPKNTLTQEQLKLLQSNIQILKSADELGIATAEEKQFIQNQLTNNCQQILTLEFAKKRGN